MKRSTTSLLSFLGLCALAVAVARPTTVVEVTPVSGRTTLIHGWTRGDGAAVRSALEPRSAPFRMVFRGTDLEARFVAERGGPGIRVRAVRKRAWLPVIQVGSHGAAISLEGRRNHLSISNTVTP